MDLCNTGLPRLATGTHPKDSGRACAMNFISYLNGDTVITDRPANVWRPLASAVIAVNDTICTHRTRALTPVAASSYITLNYPGTWAVTWTVNDDVLLCSNCSHQVFLLIDRVIGSTATVATHVAAGGDEPALSLACVAAGRLAYPNTENHFAGSVDRAAGWLNYANAVINTFEQLTGIKAPQALTAADITRGRELARI